MRKGHQNEKCNVASCYTQQPAIWKHHYKTRPEDNEPAWYCNECATRIAHACKNDGFKLFDFMLKQRT